MFFIIAIAALFIISAAKSNAAPKPAPTTTNSTDLTKFMGGIPAGPDGGLKFFGPPQAPAQNIFDRATYSPVNGTAIQLGSSTLTNPIQRMF